MFAGENGNQVTMSVNPEIGRLYSTEFLSKVGGIEALSLRCLCTSRMHYLSFEIRSHLDEAREKRAV